MVVCQAAYAEFLTLTIQSEPRLETRKATKRAKWRSSMSAYTSVLQNMLDTADIVRDRDITPAADQPAVLVAVPHLLMALQAVLYSENVAELRVIGTTSGVYIRFRSWAWSIVPSG